MLTKKEMKRPKAASRIPTMSSTARAVKKSPPPQAKASKGVTDTIASCLQGAALKKLACDQLPWPASTVCNAAVSKCN